MSSSSLTGGGGEGVVDGGAARRRDLCEGVEGTGFAFVGRAEGMPTAAGAVAKSEETQVIVCAEGFDGA